MVTVPSQPLCKHDGHGPVCTCGVAGSRSSAERHHLAQPVLPVGGPVHSDAAQTGLLLPGGRPQLSGCTPRSPSAGVALSGLDPVCGCGYVCVCVCVCVCMCVCVVVHTHMHTHTHSCTHMRTRTHTHTHTPCHMHSLCAFVCYWFLFLLRTGQTK